MKKSIIWGGWLITTITLGIFFGTKFFGSGDKSTLLIGEATYGHYQIEMACETCHTEPFGGTEILQNACVNCHAEELEIAHDSHPKSKFTDPRNADRVKILDARYCVTCHTEHQHEQTRDMGVTLPDDYCYHCHQDLEKERPSHKDLAFDSCASAGCHNYHDNRALYEDFLVKHANEPNLKPHPPSIASAIEGAFNTEPSAESRKKTSRKKATSALKKEPALTLQTSQYADLFTSNTDIAHQWQASSHAQAGVDCGGCHQNKNSNEWVEKPNHNQCINCHTAETETFLRGKHGMRLSGELSASLTPITPGQAHLAFKADAQHLEHGCNSCHGSHDFNTQKAAVAACLTCHNDDHSLAFMDSPHGKVWQESILANINNNESSANTIKQTPQEGTITCATCHMPRIEKTINGKRVLAVQHNQNDTLKPNEKMIRSACINCHGLQFSINSLADETLIKNNFNTKPSVHIPSIDWALKRAKETH